MKTKKPRFGKAVKPAARTVRRVVRTKPKVPRRKPSLAKAKGGKRKTQTKSKLVAKSKPRVAVKTKTVRKRVVRKPRAKASPIIPISPPKEEREIESAVGGSVKMRRIKAVSKRVARKPRAKASSIAVESAQTVSPLVAAPGQESEPVPSEKVEASGNPGAEPPPKKTAEAEAGLRIPQVLLEGDEPFSPPMTGPGQKYDLGPTTLAVQSGPDEAALPEAYGTGKLLLAARDPHWLYAHWDFTQEQQRRYNALSADRHLVVRVVPGTIGARPVTEVHVHPESRHWFIHTDRAETQYVAALGYYRPGRQWMTIATSAPTVTPPDTVSTDLTVRFATIPAQVPLTQLAALAKQGVPAHLPPPDAPRERALAELVGQYLVRQDSRSSVEITELAHGRGEQEVSAAQLPLPAPLGGEAGSVSSPQGVAEQRPKVFWFNINAELVIYGATEPGASVTIGGRPISLRPDGSFSCRFSLPDGDHTVTASAMSAESELRQAELRFSRRTEHRAEVGAAPQDPSLNPPAAETP